MEETSVKKPSKNVPFTSAQVKKLSAGFNQADLPGRKFFRDLHFGRIKLTALGIQKIIPMNCRSLTPGRKAYKQEVYGRIS